MSWKKFCSSQTNLRVRSPGFLPVNLARDRRTVRQSVSYGRRPDFTGFHTSPSSYRRARRGREINPSLLLRFPQTKLLPSGRRKVFILSTEARERERKKRNEMGAKKEARSVDTMPPFNSKEQSPSAFESFPRGKISPSCSGDQINVTPLPRGACRALASPRRLRSRYLPAYSLPLGNSWRGLHPQPSLI